ncbi:hypothetical protein Pse7367_2491 [Thalassoporum mexicanum PCC 7367]|uniref:hypothetical protein n=1 Tax=Thalassoporum mexicanum TaxID=3457544 RepID=UPI00029FCCE6|nr:hypothetical protein [Pseudanabaena sp. PCC 7367]AFY70751.1 hypothetical protein Pse7367_2491 [Pseudanabaena sp. PCC 7367]
MEQIKDANFPVDSEDLDLLVEQLRSLAEQHRGDPHQLLHILRVLESLHRDINDSLFQPALPNSRHELFNMLLDIETHGGWPYIYRLSIDQLCQNLDPDLDLDGDAENADSAIE